MGFPGFSLSCIGGFAVNLATAVIAPFMLESRMDSDASASDHPHHAGEAMFIRWHVTARIRLCRPALPDPASSPRQ
jgi:hypothetical protein